MLRHFYFGYFSDEQQGLDSTSTQTVSPTSTQENSTWGEWTPSSPCSVTCGNGQRNYSRICTSQVRSECFGNSTKIEPCKERPCPIGNFGIWFLNESHYWSDKGVNYYVVTEYVKKGHKEVEWGSNVLKITRYH